MTEKTNPVAEFDLPFDRLAEWLSDAEGKEPNDPTAMALATATTDGKPSVRMVLLKALDPKGLVFYTNLESRKGCELAENPNAALLFHWKSLRRQVRVEGHVQAVSDAEADDYFDSRPRKSRIGAWASAQSRPLESRFEFETAIGKYAAKYATGKVPRPPFWSGFRLIPDRFEFWEDREFRLHDRSIFTKTEQNGTIGWARQKLFP